MANEFKIKKGLIVTGASGGTVVDIQGSQGQLFSVTDDLSGSIFAVSDISGVPIFDVNSSGLSTFDGNVLVGSDSSLLLSNNATVSANAGTNDSLYLNSKGSGIVRVNFAGGTGGFEVYAGGTNSIFDVSPAGAGTFAGDVTIGGKTYPKISLTDNQGVARTFSVGTSNETFTVRNETASSDAFTISNANNATFAAQAFATTATSSGDASSTLTTKGYVDSLITGATIYRGAWDPSGGGYGSPDLSGVTQTSGYYYICSAAGTAEPNGTGTEPDTWAVGDWVIYNDVSGTGQWQKIDNSSVLSGVGTGQTVALWQGASSVTDSETLGNAPITVSGNNSFFAGDAIIPQGAFIASQISDINPVARFTNTGVNNYDFTFPDSSTIQLGSSVSFDLALKLLNAGAGDFNLDVGGNGTFAGNINAAGRLRSSTGSDSGSQLNLWADSNGHTFLAGHTFSIYTGSNNSRTQSFRIDNTKNATFAGNVTTENLFQVYSTGVTAVIGAIGNTANDVNIYSTTAGHNGLRMHVNGILPTNNAGTIIDNDADLGDPGYRFKDLYLGGSITAGGGATFAGLVSGITPVNAANFVTKAYVDGGGGAGSGFLPLSAGSGFPLTGDLYINKSAPALRLNDSGDNVPYELRVDGTTFSIKEVTNSRTLMSMTAGAVITLDSLASNTVINTTSAMVVPNGSIGIGVTSVSDWGWIIDNALQFAGGAFVAGRTDATAAINMGANAFVTATGGNAWKYFNGGAAATRYVQQVGQHYFQTAPVGAAAGDAITWSTALNILNNGNSIFTNSVSIGTTVSPTRTLDVRGTGMSIFGTGGNTELMLRGQVEGTGTVRNLGAWHWSVRSDVGGDNDDLKLLRFETGTFRGTAMQISNSTGNIGIGVNTIPNADYRLILEDTAEDILRLHNSTDGLDALISFTNPGGTLGRIQGIDNGGLGFDTGNNAGGINSNAMFIDNSGNVGIGMTSPSAFNQRVNAPHLVVGAGNNSAGLTLYSGIASQGSINFADGTTTSDQYTGGILYVHGSDNYMTFYTNGGGEKMRIGSDGAIKFNTYNLTNQTGTPTYLLGTDASGNVVKTLSSTAPGSLWLASGNNIYNTNSANVGIGITTPYTKLVIGSRGTASAPSILAYDGIAFDFYNDGPPYKRHGVIISQAADASESVLDFNTKAASGTNSTKMTILGNGNLGIGTTGPAFKFVVKDDSTNQIIADFKDSNSTYGLLLSSTGTGGKISGRGTNHDLTINTAGTGDITLIPGGNVGIGVTGPSEKLEVNGTVASIASSLPTFKVQGSDVNYQGRMRWDTNNNVLEFLTRHAGTYYSDTLVLKEGKVGIGTNNPSTTLSVQGTSSNGINIIGVATTATRAFMGLNASNHGYLFVTGSSGQNPSLINSAGGDSYISGGNVGIGTTSPGRKLQVEGGDFYTNDKSDTAGATVGYGGNSFQIRNGDTSEDLNFDIFNRTTSVWGTPLIIKNTGNVGIGTSTPLAKLDIQGTQGQLFSVTDDLSGSIFAVSDISGVPIFDVNSSGLSTFDGNVDIKTSFGGSNSYQLGVGTTSFGSIYTEGRIFTQTNITSATGNITAGLTVGSTAAVSSGVKLEVVGNMQASGATFQGTTSSLIALKTSGATLRANIIGNNNGLELGVFGTNSIKFEWDGVTKVQMKSTGEGIFAGKVSINNASNTDSILNIVDDGTNGNIAFENDSGDVVGIITSVADELNIRVGDGISMSDSIRLRLNDSGNMTIAGTLTQNSDARLKENIKPIESALDKVKQMQGVEFNKINSSTKEIGVVAQEIEKIIPELVLEDKEGIKSVAYGNITAVLIEAIKEQQKQIEELKQQLNK